MLGRRRAPAKRSHARTSRCAAPDPMSLLLDIEEPLTDAINYVEALRLTGHGLVLHGETGCNAIVAVAHITVQRLEAARETWNKLLQERRGARFRSPGFRCAPSGLCSAAYSASTRLPENVISTSVPASRALLIENAARFASAKALVKGNPRPVPPEP